jgi:NADP-dependent 3-hydroxy acid dehydrogenase YdfG
MSKIILITGASSGFGKAIAEKFAAGGWDLILTARRKEKLSEVASAIESKYGVKTLSLIFDVQDKGAVFTHLNNLPAEWQAVDLLVNNAGLALGRDSFLEANLEDWETMIDTNVKGLLYTSKAVLPYLIKQQGHIINIASIFGVRSPSFSNYKIGDRKSSETYGATKAGLIQLTKYLANYMSSYNVRVNCISPGGIENNKVQSKSFIKRYSKLTPMKRMAKPDEIINFLIFLISENASYCNGQNFIIDGGYTIK